MRAIASLSKDQWHGENLDLATDQGILDAFKDVDTDQTIRYIQATLDRDPVKKEEEALLELYKKLRPGDPGWLVSGLRPPQRGPTRPVAVPRRRCAVGASAFGVPEGR